MTNPSLRDRIADWISGGKLTEAWYDIDEVAQISNANALSCYDLRDALQRIAALETPGANATVRKMARIAREALGE